MGTLSRFYPQNCQQVCTQHLWLRQSWQARSQLWLAVENNNNIHLGVWNYLSWLVEFLPKAKNENIRWKMSLVHSPSYSCTEINSVTKNQPSKVITVIILLFKRHWELKNQRNMAIGGVCMNISQDRVCLHNWCLWRSFFPSFFLCF